jgi:acyl carrier protein
MAHDPAEVLTGLTEIIVEETGMDPDEVTPDKSFTEDLDIDSLSMMTIVTLAEDRFSVEIPDDSVKNLLTVQDAVNFIAQA